MGTPCKHLLPCEQRARSLRLLGKDFTRFKETIPTTNTIQNESKNKFQEHRTATQCLLDSAKAVPTTLIVAIGSLLIDLRCEWRDGLGIKTNIK
eukprot:3920343-Amphidinium_carterae.1